MRSTATSESAEITIRDFAAATPRTMASSPSGWNLFCLATGPARIGNQRPARPKDRPIAEILPADIKTGATVKWHQPPWSTGIHGITSVEKTGTFWVASPSLNVIVEIELKDLRIVHMIPVKGDRIHGLDWQDGVL
jgi:hypothetical protein